MFSKKFALSAILTATVVLGLLFAVYQLSFGGGRRIVAEEDLRLPSASSDETKSAAQETALLPNPEFSSFWNVRYHGTCCEGNLAAANDTAFVLLPELATGNDILKSTDGGLNWVKKYPPVDVSDPYGIEGDLQAIGDDVIFFGTLLVSGVGAKSTDRGETWTTVPIPVAFPANDQSWSYLGPFRSPACVNQTAPYTLAGWYRIGSVALFSCDGGVTYPIQTPLAADADPLHVVCITSSRPPSNPGDTRIVDNNFVNMKSGRHGAWGTDKNFYWTDTDAGSIYVCKTENFGVTWTGVKHPIAAGPGADGFVSHAAYDRKGTLYVMHGDKIYVSFNRGESFEFTHTMPKYANQDGGGGEAGSDQFFVVNNGTIHLAVAETLPSTDVKIWYLKGNGIDTAQPAWELELIDQTGAIRRDFVQIAVDGNGLPTVSYITPTRQVTTASRKNSPPNAEITAAPVSGGSTFSRQFDASASSDVDSGAIASYTFNFGDGSASVTQETPVATHTYAAPGNYTVGLTVSDSRNLTDSTSIIVNLRAPTAAAVSVGGRVTDARAKPVDKARVTITNNLGVTKTAVTNAFGFYKFEEITAGETYIIAAQSKKFGSGQQAVTVNGAISDLNLTLSN